jgi:hypothetical protein
MTVNEQRLLLPFVEGVSAEAIDYALSFGKAVQFPLVALALIPQPLNGSVRAEYIQQANDFLETIEARAEMHGLFIERHLFFSKDAGSSILEALIQLDCQGIIIPFQNNIPCFLQGDVVSTVQECTSANMYLLHLPQKTKKYVFRSMQKVFAGISRI